MFEALAVVWGLAGNPEPTAFMAGPRFISMEECEKFRVEQEPLLKKFWTDRNIEFKDLKTKCIPAQIGLKTNEILEMFK